MDQIVRTVLPAGPDGIPPIDYETVQNGCDWTTRTSVQKELGEPRGEIREHLSPEEGWVAETRREGPERASRERRGAEERIGPRVDGRVPFVAMSNTILP